MILYLAKCHISLTRWEYWKIYRRLLVWQRNCLPYFTVNFVCESKDISGDAPKIILDFETKKYIMESICVSDLRLAVWPSVTISRLISFVLYLLDISLAGLKDWHSSQTHIPHGCCLIWPLQSLNLPSDRKRRNFGVTIYFIVWYPIHSKLLWSNGKGG